MEITDFDLAEFELKVIVKFPPKWTRIRIAKRKSEPYDYLLGSFKYFECPFCKEKLYGLELGDRCSCGAKASQFFNTSDYPQLSSNHKETRGQTLSLHREKERS